MGRRARGDLPREWQSWLLEEDSLTARLQTRGGRVVVMPLWQRRAALLADERLFFQGERQGWVREVVLLADGQPVVFARSVVPSGGEAAWRFFFRLGERPLGTALFADPRVVREGVHPLRLTPRHALWRRAWWGWTMAQRGEKIGGDSIAATWWGRRSRFWRERVPLLVQEVFLPPFLPLYLKKGVL
ncbi:MAG: chorismate lyase [Hydrogenophilus sp.]|nr:chorismate lyase [Hydrogenophilus sp.]